MLTRRARLNLAYISPLNPVPSGLSDYSEMLIPALAEWADLVLYSDCGVPANPEIARRFIVRPVPHLAQHHTEHDLRLYQIGNSEQHRNAFAALRWLPGIVVLHEPFLHTSIRAVSSRLYRRELRYDLGLAGDLVAEHCWPEHDRRRLMDFPLIGRVLDSSLGLIVHSRAARHLVEQYRASRPTHWDRYGFDAPVIVVPHLMELLPDLDPSVTRREFGLPEDALLFGVAGLIDPTKQPELILRAFASVAATLQHARLVFAGELPAWYTSVPELASELGIADRIIFLGRLESLDRLHRAMAACDVIIGLRWPTIGETSGTALRAMSLGRPLIVNKTGWYDDLPDTACFKLALADGAQGLARAMIDAGQSRDVREQMGRAARQYIQQECDVSTVARRYAEFLQEAVERAWREPEERRARRMDWARVGAGQAASGTYAPELVLPPGIDGAGTFQAQVQQATRAAIEQGRLNLGDLPGWFDED